MNKEYGTYLYALKTNMSYDLVEKWKIPLFYKECIVYFHEFLRKTSSLRNRKNEIIWDNIELLHNNRPLGFKRWAKHEILIRSDII